ncbi:3-oxo-5-alpha-steroid 4-dehydrogenase [mine drainage metagenome]|uniref:3-oxo-5-alpha-steroid 4-dehydrogenase n=1 Tax=mine drainage metagenome TaxID=410659 RepID=A0A1J5SYQ0_9ZZZZ
MTILTLMFTALAVALPAFLVLFLVARRIGNFGIVDIAWAGGFAPAAVFYGLCGAGSTSGRVLAAVTGGLWSLRLGGYLAKRVLGHLGVEDGRYRELRREWAGALDVKMGAFFAFQGLLLVALSLPFALAASNPSPRLSLVQLVGVAVWLVALAGEALADGQLAAFKREAANAGRVCDRGLWGLSRHPNYFFEWLVWVGFALLALPAPHGWLALGSPALMLVFLTRVTGIRYTEEQLLRSKGEAYGDYQRRTSAFVPWFPSRTTGGPNP